MKKIALVATDVALPDERGLPRLHYLAEMLCRYGYYVDLITSNFQHWTKEFRTEESIRESRRLSQCHIAIVTQPGYKKNVELQRVISYRIYAKHVKEYLENNDYDLVYCLIPDNHIAAVSAKYAKERNIPFIVDVEDLWPEAMKMIFNVPIISDILFSNYTINAITTYKLSDGLVGSSNTYCNEPLKYNINVPNRVTVYVGNDIDDFDRGAKENLSKVNKPEGEFWISYAGTLGTSYDIATLIQAADILAKKGLTNIKIMIMGDGPLRQNFEDLAHKLSGNVEFLGYLSHDLMAAYLVKSDVTINSFVKKAPQSFVSKIGDYLAAGKPMINTCVDPEFWKKVENEGFGINVEPENPVALARVIVQFKNYKNMCLDMGRIARDVAEREFNKAYTYLKIVDLVDSLVGDKRELYEKCMDEVATNAI